MNRSSLALCLLTGCGGYVASTTSVEDAAVDASTAGSDDAGSTDAGSADSGDAGSAEAGDRDSGPARDASTRDAAANDAGTSRRSQGCGMSASGDGEFSDETLRVGNTERSYHVRLPDAYDPTRAYALIFRFHGYSGTGLSGGLDIQGPAGDDAIIVAPDGLNTGWFDSSEAGDLALFDGMYESISERYCVDFAKVYAYGFSMGGGFTNLLGCRRADKLRATAAIAGFDRGTGTCANAVAAWFQHGSADDSVPIAQGRSARDRMITRNGCSTTTTPADGCVRYQGCDEPVVWCETTNGHDIAGGTAPQAVWEFFTSLPDRQP